VTTARRERGTRLVKLDAPGLDGITIEVVLVTPELAREFLAANAHNRSMRPLLVEQYARDMRDEDFPFTGDPIRFDLDGTLMDGQHRCEACTQTGLPFWAVVIRGLSPDVMDVIDTGAKRKLSDVLKLRGEVDTFDLAAAIRMGWRWDTGPATLRSNTGVSNPVALRWLEEHPEIRLELHNVSGMQGAPLYLAPRISATFALRARRLEPEEVVVFLHKLEHGDELARRDPIFALRRLLIASHTRQDRDMTPYKLLGLVIKTWNYWLGSVQVDNITFRANERFPTLAGGRDVELAVETYEARRARVRGRVRGPGTNTVPGPEEAP